MTRTVNSGGVSSVYALSTDISTISTTSQVYYYSRKRRRIYRVIFGDGTLGFQLLDGDIITVDYIIVDEQHADGVPVNLLRYLQ